MASLCHLKHSLSTVQLPLQLAIHRRPRHIARRQSSQNRRFTWFSAPSLVAFTPELGAGLQKLEACIPIASYTTTTLHHSGPRSAREQYVLDSYAPWRTFALHAPSRLPRLHYSTTPLLERRMTLQDAMQLRPKLRPLSRVPLRKRQLARIAHVTGPLTVASVGPMTYMIQCPALAPRVLTKPAECPRILIRVQPRGAEAFSYARTDCRSHR